MSVVTSRDGTVIDYDHYGAGPAVIFVSGASQHRAIDHRTARAATLLAAEGFAAIDYDRRGRDRSGDTAPWALEREVEDLGALLEVAGGRAVAYSSSSGATIALAAAGAGLGITSLILYEPPFFPGEDHAEHLAMLRSLIAAGRHEKALRYDLRTVLRLPARRVRELAEKKDWWSAMVSIAPTLAYDLAALQEVNLDPDWRARWAGVAVPVIVCSGDQTYPGLPGAADAVAAALPNASRRVLPGQAHGPDAEAIVPVLREALAAALPAGE